MQGQEAFQAGRLGIIAMRGCEKIAAKVDNYIREWRKDAQIDVRDSYLVQVSCPRFGTGEGKAIIEQSIRGDDLFIVCDIYNYSLTYDTYGKQNRMSPDDHYADLKRIISAAGGKARRINVIMPMLYGGRQHRRSARESLDCAQMLQELETVGVKNIITFDAHDPRVQNAIPYSGFENIMPYYQMIKALKKTVPDIEINSEKLMIVSPDEGAMGRCIYYSSVLGIDLGMYYKRRDYSRVVNGRNPIVAHEFLGNNIKDKDVIIVDDVIATGDSILDIAEDLHNRGAKKIYVFATFGQFWEGGERFEQAHKAGFLERVFTTNLNYRPAEIVNSPWYSEVDMSKYIAFLIDNLNYDNSISDFIDPVKRIKALLAR